MESDQELKELVDLHTMRYEVWPHYDIPPDGGEKVMDGFDLELHGTHDHGRTSLTPGCERCKKTYEDLRKIAAIILPKEKRLSEYEIDPFDSSLHAWPGRESEVIVTIHIQHRQDHFAPIDPCEQRCLHEMEAKLAELGVRAGKGARAR